MQTLKTIFIIVVVALIGFAIAGIINPSVDTENPLATSQDQNIEKNESYITTITFENEDEERLAVDFNTDTETATFNYQGEKFILDHVEAASGAKYANDDASMVLWNKGEELTLEQNGEIVYVGQTSGIPVTSEENGEFTLDNQLTSTVWEWTATEYPTDEGGVAPQPQSDAFTLDYNSEGQFSGTTDCNNFGGSYVTDGAGKISYGPMFMTKMYCEGSQESVFVDLVNRSDSYFIDDEGRLIFMLPLDSGSVIFTATKTS